MYFIVYIIKQWDLKVRLVRFLKLPGGFFFCKLYHYIENSLYTGTAIIFDKKFRILLKFSTKRLSVVIFVKTIVDK